MYILYIVNLVLLVFVINKYGLDRINLKVLSYYFLCIFGLTGSYISITGEDWWLQDVSNINLLHAYVSFNIIIGAAALVLILQKTYPFPKSMVLSKENKFITYGFLFTCGTSVVITFIFLFPNSALLSLLQGNLDALYLAETRRSMGVKEDGGAVLIYFQNIVVRYILPYVSIYFLLEFYYVNGRITSAMFALSSLLFCSAQSLAKFPIIEVFIIIFIVQHSCGKLNYKKIFTIMSTLALTMVGLYLYVMGAESEELIELIGHRIFVAQYVGLPIAMEVFPMFHPYLEIGSLLGTIGRLFSYESMSFSLITMDYANPWGVIAGTAGYLSTISFAEGYAVGGTFGMYMAAMIAYAYISLLDRIYSISTNIYKRSAYLLFLIKVPLLMIDSLSAMLLNYGLIFVMLFVSFVVPVINRRG